MSKYVKALRFAEVGLLTGFVMIGAVFSLGSISQETLVPLIQLFILAFLSINALYAFNSYCGREADEFNERLNVLKALSPKEYLVFFLIFFSLALGIALYLGTKVFLLTLVLGALGIAYSLPTVGKGNPLLGTIIHFFFQVTAFQIAYVVFQPVSLDSMLISAYFAFLYMAGHFHHQVIDFEADQESSLNTGAVKFGVSKASKLSIKLFATATLLWTALYWTEVINGAEYTPFLLAFLIQLAFYSRDKPRFESKYSTRISYRTTYRILYLLASLVLVESKLGDLITLF